MKRAMSWWIKERHNPQLGTYYVACGQMFRSEANRKGRNPLYGANRMLEFTTEAEYFAKLSALRKAGESVQE